MATSTYEVLEKIGQGSFGIIRKVQRKDTGQILCRKEISYSRMSEKEKEQLYAELKILESLKHPNIVQYCHREHIKSSNDLHLYMEYCGNGDLGGYIKKIRDRNQFAEEEFIWTIFSQLIGALYRCHYGENPPEPGHEGIVKKGRAFQTKEGYRVILHRDLKPENVFLSQNNAVKLGDFGLSKIIAAHDFASTYVGTPYYMSPEICAAERYSHHSDVWSLGCIIYELTTRCVPFDARSHVELVMKIKSGKLKPLPAHYSQELWEVIQWCLKVDPRSRPDTAQLLNVPQIKMTRARLEQASALERAQHEFMRMQNERDVALSRLQPAQKQVQELQRQVAALQEAEKKMEMEWHARATLAIDQRVSEEVKRLTTVYEKQLADLRQQDNTQVEQRVQEELRLHYASLPSSHGASQGPEVAAHIRSSTPPPGKHTASFTTTTTTGRISDASSNASLNNAGLETDLSSLSIMEQELGDSVSPLAQRSKPKRSARMPFGRAKTVADYHFANTADSPMDVHMADPSPMPNHVAAPSSIKGLSLSPRRRTQDKLAARGRNIFSLAAEQKLRPALPNESSSFADDDSDCDAIFEDSPSRASSRLSNMSNGGDPFKALGPTKQPLKRARPSLGRQQTMPVNSHQPIPTTRTKIQPFPSSRNTRKSPEKENRPPSSHARSNVPVINASPKRTTTTQKEGKDLTPTRRAPPPPSGGLARLAHANNNKQSPGRVKGRTLVELQQVRLGPDSDVESSSMLAGAPKLLPSPAKWDPTVDEMPSPFLARKGRTMVH